MIKLVIFDLDDTLYDEIQYCKSGFHAVSQCLAQTHPTLRHEEFFEAFWTQFTSGNTTKTFNVALESLGITTDRTLISSLIEVYRQHIPDIILPDQSRQLLDYCKQNYTLALLSDGFLPAQQLKVQALEIEHYFDCIMYTEELGREHWKPSALGFEKILEKLSFPPDQAVYIADNLKKDFIAPNKLGFAASIHFIRPYKIHNNPAPSKKAQPTHTAKDTDQIKKILSFL